MRLLPLLVLGCARLDVAQDHVVVGAAAGAAGDLIGWNIGRGTLYGPPGDPLHPEWRTPERTEAFARLAAIRGQDGPLVRFSGLQIDGTLGGDGYHWWRYADPDHVVSADDNMAPFQYMAIVDELGGRPLVTLNVGSGTAREAADYVAHLVGTDADDPRVAARHQWGRMEPWRPRAYELGNEIYAFWNTGYGESEHSFANPDAPGGGDPDWHGRPASDPRDYAARALTYVAAVLTEDPQARFWIPLSQASMDAWGGPDAAVDALSPLLAHEAVESVVVHHYQVDDAITLGFEDYASPELVIGGFEAFRPLYAELQRALSTLPGDAPPGIVVTEYHAAGAFTFGRFDPLAETHMVGLGVADVLLGLAQVGVHAAAQHMAVAFGGPETEELLFETWYNPTRHGDGVSLRSSAVATGLIARHLAEERHALQVQTDVLDYRSGDQRLAAPAIHGMGWSGAQEGSVVLLHRDMDRRRVITVDLPEGWSVQAVQAYAPENWMEGAPEVVSLPWEQRGDRVALELPPHALVAIGALR